ncbi:MAG: S9 family peptidase [Chloroflexota bacterium]|nr:S9 family peptidase [Chloroflexota bacterium]
MSQLTPETLVYETVAAGDPYISPDGTRVVYSRAEACKNLDRATSQVWLSNVDGSDPRRLTWAGDRNREPRWSPDGHNIAFVSDRLKAGSGLFVLPANGPGEAREITHHLRPIGHLAWSPDGSSIAYTTSFDPDNPNEEAPPENRAPKVRVTRRLDYKQDNRGWVNDARTQVFVVNIASGERRMLTREPDDVLYPQWSSDGKTLAAQVTLANGIHSQLALIDVESGQTRRVGPEEGSVGVWAWSPRGDRVFFAGSSDPSPGADLFIYDLGSDTIRRLTWDLACAPDVGFPTVQAPSQPVWLDDSRAIFHALRGGASGFYTFNIDTADLQLEHSTYSVSTGFSIDAARRFVVQAHSSLDSLSEVAVYDRQAGQRKLVTRQNASLLKAAQPASWERFDVERGGSITQAWLLKPPSFDPDKKYPVVLDVHGGPHGFYGYGFNAVQQVLASHGFLVVFSNPRGSGSYGREFAEQVRTDWGGEDYLDLMAVLDTVLQRPYADAGRTGIWGYSYGGFMTAWAIGHTQRFKAAVCGAPCFDLESMYGTSDISHVWGPYQWGGKPHEASEAFAAHSPSSFAHRATTPTLIVHGEADDRCPIGQGEQMFVALKQAGCEVEFARYPGGAHAMLRVGPPSHRADFLERVLAWFTCHLREPQPA